MVDDTQVDLVSSKLTDILGKLDALIRLQVMEMAEGKNQSEQIWLFAVAGLSPKATAEIIGTTSNTVRVALSNIRRIRRQRRGRKEGA